MNNHIAHTTGKYVVLQMFGYIFLYSKIKTSDSGPKGNKHSTAKKIRESYSVGFTALSSVLYDVSKPTASLIKFGSVLLCFM
jgi:hypothetical protein